MSGHDASHLANAIERVIDALDLLGSPEVSVNVDMTAADGPHFDAGPSAFAAVEQLRAVLAFFDGQVMAGFAKHVGEQCPDMRERLEAATAVARHRVVNALAFASAFAGTGDAASLGFDFSAKPARPVVPGKTHSLADIRAMLA